MADLENYRQIIKRILTEYYDMKVKQGKKTPECEVSDRRSWMKSEMNTFGLALAGRIQS